MTLFSPSFLIWKCMTSELVVLKLFHCKKFRLKKELRCALRSHIMILEILLSKSSENNNLEVVHFQEKQFSYFIYLSKYNNILILLARPSTPLAFADYELQYSIGESQILYLFFLLLCWAFNLDWCTNSGGPGRVSVSIGTFEDYFYHYYP